MKNKHTAPDATFPRINHVQKYVDKDYREKVRQQTKNYSKKVDKW